MQGSVICPFHMPSHYLLPQYMHTPWYTHPDTHSEWFSKSRSAKSKGKSKTRKKAAAMVSSQEDPDTVCSVCKKEFPSRNKLFQHIKETGHAVHISVSGTEARACRTSDHTRRKGKRRKWPLTTHVQDIIYIAYQLLRTFALHFRQQNPCSVFSSFSPRELIHVLATLLNLLDAFYMTNSRWVLRGYTWKIVMQAGCMLRSRTESGGKTCSNEKY